MGVFFDLPECKECTSKINFYDRSLDIHDLKVKQENQRNIYFAPVGNQFNFGVYNNGKTPKIVLMGITTSPTARDNFCRDYRNYYNKKQSVDEAIKKSCLLNIFNSKPPTLLRRLSKILNFASLWKLVRIDGNIELCEQNFYHYIEGNADHDFNRVMDNVYFTQLIPCASCLGKYGRKAPTVRDIGNKHQECINAQVRFFRSFKREVSLLISFGSSDNFPGFNKIKEKCINHIKISHPAGAWGWNKLDIMDLSNEKFMEKVQCITDKRYRNQVIKCRGQIEQIKDIVHRLTKSSC